MKHLDEYRNSGAVRRLAADIAAATTRPWNLMEVCGGQTHSILRYGLDELLPDEVRLIHGPGCPVCVTPVAVLDAAIALAARPEVIFCSFGDMLRVPGSRGDLLRAKSAGGDVRAVYSPLDAVRLAARSPRRQVVFFAIGFETTAPANAAAVLHAEHLQLTNFSLLACHVLVPPALELILGSPGNVVQGVLAAGHVCAIVGSAAYESLAARRRVPIVVTGFEPVDLLRGVLDCIAQLESGRHEVHNSYGRVVQPAGNATAQAAVQHVFVECDQAWRGLGVIPTSGLRMRDEYARFDAMQRFEIALPTAAESAACRAGDVLRGAIAPPQCPAFGRACTPETPLGAPMVSAEGACAAYFRYAPLGRSNA